MSKTKKYPKASPGKAQPSTKESTAAVASVKSTLSLKHSLAILCAVIGFLLYVNTINHDYCGDDGMVIKDNKITTKGISAIPEIFKTGYREGFWDRKENFYRPLSVAMFAIEYEISPLNPHIGHFVNVLLYALTGFVLFLTLSSLMKNRNLIVPLVATILFVVHPVHTEVVANIKSRDEILALLLTLCSFYFLSSYLNKKTIANLVISGMFFFLALLSKESSITCVAIVPLLCWFYGKNFSVKGTLPPFLAFLAAAIVYFLIRLSVLKGVTNFDEQIAAINNSIAAAPDYITRFATAVLVLGKYLFILFLPYRLVSDYSFNQIPNVGLSNIYALISILIYAALIIYSIIKFRSKDLIAFGILFFLISISLVSNIALLIESAMAERFLYLASIGFCIAIATLLTNLFKSNLQEKSNSFAQLVSGNKALFTTVSIVFILFSFKTISRNADWKNDLTLLKADVELSPESARVHYAYGMHVLADDALKEKDETAKTNKLNLAIKHLEKSVAILPTFPNPSYYLGIAYKEKGEYGNAIKSFLWSRSNNMIETADFNLQMGITYSAMKQYDKAIEEYKQAALRNPLSYDAFLNLGSTYDAKGEHEKSIEALKKAIELNPTAANPYYVLGNTYVHMGNFQEAIEWFKKASGIEPTMTAALNNIANCYVTIKEYAKGIEYYKKVLAIEPQNPDALANMAVANMLMGNQ